MPKHHLTLSAPGRSGELTWDDEAGTFAGSDADLLTQLAVRPQWHPGLPQTEALATTDARALIVLLHCLGWDAPAELADEVRAWRKEADHVPRDAVA